MLLNIRQHAQGWIAWIIAGVLCLAFALWGIEYYIGSGGGNAPAATVNGEDISNAQWEASYRRLQQTNPLGQQATFNQALQAQFKNQALQELIEQEILIQAATKSGYVVTPPQVTALVTSLPELQVNGQFSQALFNRIVQQFFSSEQAFLKDIQDKSTILQARAGVIGTTFTLPNEVDQLTQLMDEQRDVQIAKIPAADFVKTAKISDEDISQYYQTHQADFMTKEQLSLQYIMLSAENANDKISIDEAQIQQYYQDNIAVFSTLPEWQIAHILVKGDQQKAADVYQKLQSGQNFAALALTYSDDKSTAIKGGLLGWIKSGDVSPQVLRVLNTLQVNQVSMPIQTEDGFEIVKLLAIKPAESKPLASIREQVEHNLKQQKIAQLLADESEELANLTYTNPDTLQTAADDLGITIQTTPFFGREGLAEPVFLSMPRVLAIAFGENVLEQRNNSDVISIDDTHAIVIRLAEYKPSVVRPLANVRNDIENTLKEKAASEQAQAKAQEIHKALNTSNASLAEVADKNNISWRTHAQVSRKDEQGLSSEVIKQVFSLPIPAKDKRTAGIATADNGDAYVVVLEKVIPGSKDSLNAQEREMLRQSIAAQMADLEYYLYIQYYTDKAKIKVP
jgi:peptidyl-prolyl cis-trans isomerase D